MKIFSQIILMTIDESIKRKLAFMPGRLKIKEIAEQTGASASTVSRILSGRSSAKQPIRQAVLESARKLGAIRRPAKIRQTRQYRGEPNPHSERIRAV